MSSLQNKIPAEFLVALECDLFFYQGKFEKKHLLPDFEDLFDHHSFAQVHGGWSEEGLFFQVQATCSLHEANSVELFVDTKNLKTAKTTHRYCHHFLFYPEAHEGKVAEEIASFRSEDRHPLTLSEELDVKTNLRETGYEMKVHIPVKSLVGFQPEEGGAIGLSYRINCEKGQTQYFGVSDCVKCEFYPYLWPTLRMKKR